MVRSIWSKEMGSLFFLGKEDRDAQRASSWNPFDRSRTRLFPFIITSLGLYGSVVGSPYDFQGSEYLEPLL